MSLSYNGDHQLPITQGIQDALRFGGGTALHIQSPRLAALGIREW